MLLQCRIRRSALWILSEYCTTRDDIQNVMTLIRQSLGEVAVFHVSFVIITSAALQVE